MCFSFNVVVVFHPPFFRLTLVRCSLFFCYQQIRMCVASPEKKKQENSLPIPIATHSRAQQTFSHFSSFLYMLLRSHHHHHRPIIVVVFGRCCRYVCIFYHPFTLIPLVEILLLFRSRKKTHITHTANGESHGNVWENDKKFPRVVFFPLDEKRSFDGVGEEKPKWKWERKWKILRKCRCHW